MPPNPPPDLHQRLERNAERAALKIMIAGFIGAILLCLPPYAFFFEKDWPWATGFPVAILWNGFECFITFFHEIGHSVAGWFYGIPTVPMFDPVHGGGWAYAPVGQIIPLLVVIWAAAGYGFFVLFKDAPALRIAIALLFLFNVATAFTDLHSSVIDFMGPAFEPLTGALFLYRALFDLAPRGDAERFMNALFGFAMPFHTLIQGWGLTHSEDVRNYYWNQKDAQGAGDFDKIAARSLHLDFNEIVIIWMALTVLCLIVPFLLYAWDKMTKTDDEPA